MTGKRGERGAGSRTSEKGEKKGGKGKNGAGKGGNGLKGGSSKGGGKGKKGEARDADQYYKESVLQAPTTVQELEARLEKEHSKSGATQRRDVNKMPLECDGTFVQVKKHSDMGCAVVTFLNQQSRDAVMQLAERKFEVIDGRPVAVIDGVEVQLRLHIDKASQNEIKTDIFIAWGRKKEKERELAAKSIAEAIDSLMVEARGDSVTTIALHDIVAHDNIVRSGNLVAPLSPSNGPHSAPMNTPPPMVPAPQFNPSMFASPPPSVAPTPGLQTPPRGRKEMRADAPDFTPPPVSFADQSQQYTFPSWPDQMNNDYNNFFHQNQMGAAVLPQQPERKQFKIVDPKSGETIETPAIAAMALQKGFVPTPVRKPAEIVDPTSGMKVDTLGMIFTPAEEKKKFAIIDPSTKNSIQV
jgi:hypothetical protein